MERTRARILVAVAMVATLGAVSASIPTDVVVDGGTPAQQRLVRWALDRYADEGFDLPHLEIHFSEDRADCAAHLGYYEDGVIWFCHPGTSEMAERGIVHEIAHGWIDAVVPDDVRARFLDVRGLETWNDWDVPWDDRGSEQAAEIVAWAVGDQADGIRAPSFPGNSRAELAEAYRSLTGRPLPALEPSDLWTP